LLRLLGKVRDRDIVAGLAAAFFGDAADSAGGNLTERLAESSLRRRLALPRKLADRGALKKISREVAALADPVAGLYLAPVAVSDKGVVRLYRLADCLPAMLYRSVAALTTYRAILPPDAQEVDRVVLHRLRIVAKELRYLLEMADLLPGAPFAALTQAFKRLQDILGDWHDGLLVRDFLAGLADWPGERTAASSWIIALDEREDGLQRDFVEIWREATPEWFHTHLARALSSLYASDLGAGCACCAKSGACPAGPTEADPI
jgi:CHAD domain-containing protein